MAGYTPAAIALRYRAYAAVDATAGFVRAYRDILRAGPPQLTPCLVHCTAGKDRTGLLCALVLALCGVDDGAIAWEYALTEQGLSPLREAFAERLMAAQRAEQEEQEGEGEGEGEGARIDRDGAMRLLSARPQSMLAALEAIREDYGSVENYVLTECELEPQAIEQLCRNFIIDDKSTR